ncbi:hypothetical protein ACFTZM_28475, partial [Streptomyces hydrogenans]|uniref:hypothetical protein n=1 Tax=Streptomyces hydrogenans TaxID=1873719 RepID=UPI00362C72EC
MSAAVRVCSARAGLNRRGSSLRRKRLRLLRLRGAEPFTVPTRMFGPMSVPPARRLSRSCVGSSTTGPCPLCPRGAEPLAIRASIRVALSAP